MAVDSEAKRWSMLQLASGPAAYSVVFNPDTSGLIEIERATVLKLYGGISWGEAVEPEPEPEPAPEARGGGGGRERRERRPPFTGRGFFDGFEPFVEPTPETVQEPADATSATAPGADSEDATAGGIADLSRARDRREAAQVADRVAEQAAARARAELDRDERKTAELRVLAFLEAEADREAELLADDEALLELLLDMDNEMKTAIREWLQTRRAAADATGVESMVRGMVDRVARLARSL